VGDFDGDGDVDAEDLARFVECVSGPGIPYSEPECGAADYDLDGDIDLFDFDAFQPSYSG
jgi:hypothetical protein